MSQWSEWYKGSSSSSRHSDHWDVLLFFEWVICSDSRKVCLIWIAMLPCAFWCSGRFRSSSTVPSCTAECCRLRVRLVCENGVQVVKLPFYCALSTLAVSPACMDYLRWILIHEVFGGAVYFWVLSSPACLRWRQCVDDNFVCEGLAGLCQVDLWSPVSRVCGSSWVVFSLWSMLLRSWFSLWKVSSWRRSSGAMKHQLRHCLS